MESVKKRLDQTAEKIFKKKDIYKHKSVLISFILKFLIYDMLAFFEKSPKSVWHNIINTLFVYVYVYMFMFGEFQT